MQGGAVMVEPYVAAQEFSITVIDAAGGPVALLPTEISLSDPEDLLVDAQLELDMHDAANKVRIPKKNNQRIQGSVIQADGIQSLLRNTTEKPSC